MGYHKIWRESRMPFKDEEGMFISVSSTTLREKYETIELARMALDELAKSEFNYSKYRKKKVKTITKTDKGYVIELDIGKYGVTERYYVL